MSGRVEMSYFDDPETLENHRKTWEGVHKRGVAFFILIVGGLGLGGFAFIVTTCWDVFVQREQTGALLLAASALFWCLDGLCWGAVVWHFGEKRYRAARKVQGSTNGDPWNPS